MKTLYLIASMLAAKSLGADSCATAKTCAVCVTNSNCVWSITKKGCVKDGTSGSGQTVHDAQHCSGANAVLSVSAGLAAVALLAMQI